MPYGQDPTTPPADERRGGYGRDPTQAPPTGKRPDTLKQAPSGSFWDQIQRYGAGSVASLEMGARQLSSDLWDTVKDVGQSLLPGQEGAQAGRRVLGKVGDVGTFASGGLTGPLGISTNPYGRLAEGVNVPPARVAEVPQGLARLPPPTLTTPGPGVREGIIPQGPRATTTMPEGVPGPPSPLVQAPPGEPSTIQMGRPGQLALPPPSIGVPGAPGVEIGPGRPAPPGPTVYPPPGTGLGPLGPTPVPGAGLLPQGPGATMRTVPPGAPSPVQPGTSFTGTPGRTSAEIGGAAAGRDLPPRAPGTEGRPASRALPEPPPLIPHGAERSPPSLIADAFASNDASFSDRAVTERFRRATKPGVPPPRGDPERSLQDQHITNAVDTIVEKQHLIRFRDPNDPSGATLLQKPRLPHNLDEFSQAIDFMKGEIYQAYDWMAQRIGGRGVRIDLAPTANKLRELANDPTITDITPTIRKQALDMADRLEMRGSYTPQEAQNTVQSMNHQLQSFWKKRQTEEIYSHPTLINQVRRTLLDELNGTMERALGDPRYQALRNRYASLASIENNVGQALGRQLQKTTGVGENLFNLADFAAFFAGAVHFDPKVMGTAVATKAAQAYARYRLGPNYAVSRMFRERDAQINPGWYGRTTGQLSTRIGGALGEARQRTLDQSYIGTTGP